MKFEEIGADNGSARIESGADVLVGSVHTWTITYTAGKAGISVGGGIRLSIPVHFSEPQFTDANAPGHTVVHTSRPGSRAEIRLRDTHTVEIPDPAGKLQYPSRGFARPENPDLWIIPHPWGWRFYIKIHGEPLEAGDRITIVYGTRGATPGTVAPRRAYFRIGTDTDGKRSGLYSGYRLIAEQPSIMVLSGEAARLIVTVPSVVEKGGSVAARAQGMDCHDNPSRRQSPEGEAGPAIVSAEEDLVFDPVIVSRPGILSSEATIRPATAGMHHILVKAADGSAYGRSNPFRVCEGKPERSLYWGDIHGHTFCSDGLGTLDEYYSYAKEISRLDIAATADHSQYMSDDEWLEIQDAAKRFHEPGSFVTFSGYEYSHNAPTAPYYGDKNIYFSDDDNPIFRANNKWRSYWSDFRAVCDMLPEGKTLIIPHAHAGCMDAGYDRRFMPVVEMRSMHGSFELPREAPPGVPWWKRSGGSLQELLQKGIRVGVIASGDGHEGHPGHAAHGSRRSNFGALMGVWCGELTRDSVWDAVWRRSCYATTGQRIYLEFSVNDAFMGSEIPLDGPAAERRISVTAAGEQQIEKVEIIKDNDVFHTQRVYGDMAQIEITDAEYCRGQGFYYVRITQIDGNQAWSSPVWVFAPPEQADLFPRQIVRG